MESTTKNYLKNHFLKEIQHIKIHKTININAKALPYEEFSKLAHPQGESRVVQWAQILIILKLKCMLVQEYIENYL